MVRELKYPNASLTCTMAPTSPTMTKQKRVLDKRPATGEWQHSTIKLIDEARQSKQNSMILRDQNITAKKVTDQDVVDTGNVVKEELRKKVALTAKLKVKLEKQVSLTRKELEALLQARAKTKERLEEKRVPLKVSSARVATRQAKPSSEQINDTVERTLHRELSELQASVTQLSNLVESSAALVSRLELSLKSLESDLRDKTESLRLDKACLDVTPLAAEISTNTVVSKSGLNPEAWCRDTAQLLTDAAELQQRSMRLRKIINKVITSLGQTHNLAYSAVNDALRHKVKQTKTLHSQLLCNLEAVTHEMQELSKHREQIHATLVAKQGPLSVVAQRLGLRRKRPNREAIRDNVEEALEMELAKLKQTMDALHHKLDIIDTEYGRLARLKRQLEQDLNNKTTALTQDKKALALDLNCIRSNASSSRHGSEKSANTARSSTSLPSIPRSYARTPR
eukprot:TRINITY_DN16769_c0_g1_i1.p1 TRINITY_DN16769_c0_g1~~TRINITY_DN16769_c0_g1_i1.p1  ORF type:complete len:454 (+),score=78.12 TRINITY_DN16769_c0_g1_i1:46-1407(+)